MGERRAYCLNKLSRQKMSIILIVALILQLISIPLAMASSTTSDLGTSSGITSVSGGSSGGGSSSGGGVATEDQYEPDSEEEAPEIIVDGDQITGYYDVAGDNDWVKFEAEAGSTYIILAESNKDDVATSIAIYSAGITWHRQQTPVGGSSVTWTASTNGSCYVNLQSMGGPGSYDITVVTDKTVFPVDPFEPDNEKGQARKLISHGVEEHTIFNPKDVDWFQIKAVKGGKYTIKSKAVDGYIDTYISLYNDMGKELASDGYDYWDRDSKIELIAPEDGSYYLSIKSRAGVGQYTVEMVEETSEPVYPDNYESDNEFNEARHIEANGVAQNHTIHDLEDSDWVSFQAIAGQPYLAQTTAINGSKLQLTIYGQQGEQVTGGSGRVLWTPLNNETYYIRVSSGETIGKYEISLVKSQSDASLKQILVDGKPLRDFYMYRGVYYYQTSGGYTNVPQITGIAAQTNATVEVQQAKTIPGTAAITVASEDKSIRRAYSVKFLAGDDFENDDEQELARSITTDGSWQKHTLGYEADIDWLKFEAVKGKTYVIRTSELGPGVDTYVKLYWNQSEISWQKDDWFTQGSSQVAWTPKVSGTCYLYVQNTGLSGDYQVSVSEYAGSPALKRIYVNGQPLQQFKPDIKEYTLQVPPGNTAEVPKVTALADDPQALIEIQNVNRVPGKAKITVTTPNKLITNQYIISFGLGDKYEPDDTLETSKTIEVNEVQEHSFDQNDDVDIVKFEAVEGQTYTIASYMKGYGALALWGPDGEWLDGAYTSTPTIIWTAPTSGTYYIECRTMGMLGSYSLSVSTSQNDATLRSITVGGKELPEFQAQRNTYYIPITAIATIPQVGARATALGTTVQIVQASSLPGTARIETKAADGKTTDLYEIKFFISDPNIVNHKREKAITLLPGGKGYTQTSNPTEEDWYKLQVVDGESYMITLTGSPGGYVYVEDENDIITSGTVAHPAVFTAQENGTYYLRGLNWDSVGEYTIRVTPTQADASIKDLQIEGNSLGKLDSWEDTYYYQLPEGTTSVPQITAISASPKAKVIIKQANTLADQAQVMIIAADRETMLVYYVKFIEGDQYENDNWPLLAKSISPDGIPQSRSLSKGNDIDWIRVEAVAGQSYAFEFKTWDFRAMAVRLLDPTGTDIAWAYGYDPCLIWTARTSGIHYLAMFTGSDGGEYEVRVTPTERDASLKSIALNGYSFLEGSIYPGKYIEYISPKTTVPPVITAVPADSRASVTVQNPTTLPGKAVITVTSKDGSTSQEYVIDYQIGDDYEADSTWQQAQLLRGTSVAQNHTLGVNDSDWYKFEATRGKTYTIAIDYVKAEDRTYSRYLYGSLFGDLTNANNHRAIKTFGRDDSSKLVWTAPDNGTYYFVIEGEQDYKLTWSVKADETPSSPVAGSGSPVSNASQVEENRQINAEYDVQYPGGDKQEIKLTLKEDQILKSINNSDSPVKVIIPVTQGAKSVETTLSSKLLAELVKKSGMVELQTSVGSYKLPIDQIDVQQLANLLDAKAADVNVRITVAQASQAKVEAINNFAKTNGLGNLITPVEFRVEAFSGTKSLELESFGQYISRSVKLTGNVDPNTTVALVLNEDGTMSPVPMELIKVNGNWVANIKRKTNSVYTVVSSQRSFNDVKGHWAAQDINTLASKLIINGKSKDVFSPESRVTRAAFAAILVRALGLTTIKGEQQFADLPRDHWAYAELTAAVDAGLLKGYADGSIHPEGFITREEVAVILARSSSLIGLQLKQPQEVDRSLAQYGDAQRISSWAKVDMALVSNSGLLKGDANKNVNPKNNCTRAEIAVLIKRMLTEAKFI